MGWAVLFCFLTASCTKEQEPSFLPRGTVIDCTEKGRLSVSQIIDYVTEEVPAEIARYDVTYYVIRYRTDYMGKSVDSEGLLLIPEGVDSVRLLAYFHGTIVPLEMFGIRNQVPSFYRGQKEGFYETINLGFSFATAGYTVFIPDYIGYGITSDREHPYVYYPELFKANIDGLIASQEFLKQSGFSEAGRLFLTGVSQGGGASLSAHRYIQENYAAHFTVVASSQYAGPYNFQEFIYSVFRDKDKKLTALNLYTWAGYTLTKFSGIKRPTDRIFTYPVFDQVAAFNPPSQIPSAVFNPYFISKILDGTDSEYGLLIDGNSFHRGWRPLGRVFLHHGDEDNIVPYFNSVDAYNGLKSAGGDITLYTYGGGGHITEAASYILKTIEDFNAIQ